MLFAYIVSASIYVIAPLSATLHVCPGHPARTGRCFMPRGRGEHATCTMPRCWCHPTCSPHKAIIQRYRVVDWLLGRSRFQSRDLLRLAHRVSRVPVTDVVLCDLIASWARRPKNHGFTTNPRTRRQMNWLHIGNHQSQAGRTHIKQRSSFLSTMTRDSPVGPKA